MVCFGIHRDFIRSFICRLAAESRRLCGVAERQTAAARWIVLVHTIELEGSRVATSGWCVCVWIYLASHWGLNFGR